MTSPLIPRGTRLKEKVILVTGSGTGIGEGMARRFVSEGARVMLHDKHEDSLPALVSELGDNTSYVIGDLEDPAIPARLASISDSSRNDPRNPVPPVSRTRPR